MVANNLPVTVKKNIKAKTMLTIYCQQNKLPYPDYKISLVNPKEKEWRLFEARFNLNVVKVGEANKHLVEFAEALDVLCVQFVRSISTTKLSELFSSSQVEEAPLLYQLMSKVHKLKDKDEVKVTRKCMNCQQDPCITNKICTIFAQYCQNICTMQRA